MTYSISGTEISIDPATGVMSFGAAPDFEDKNSYIATITASDGENTSTQDITVTITNLNDNALSLRLVIVTVMSCVEVFSPSLAVIVAMYEFLSSKSGAAPKLITPVAGSMLISVPEIL